MSKKKKKINQNWENKRKKKKLTKILNYFLSLVFVLKIL
jgi:hypothetical protein